MLRECQGFAGLTDPYKLIWHIAPKLARIECIEPHFSSGQLQFLGTRDLDDPELIEQLVHFP